jgi:hypothetical protein
MDKRRLKQISDELERLMQEQMESLQRQTFLGITAEELSRERERLKRIREVSAEFLEGLKKSGREPSVRD